PRGVELLAGGPGDPDVVGRDLGAGRGLRTGADLDVLDDELGGRGVTREVDLGLGLLHVAERGVGHGCLLRVWGRVWSGTAGSVSRRRGCRRRRPGPRPRAGGPGGWRSRWRWRRPPPP